MKGLLLGFAAAAMVAMTVAPAGAAGAKAPPIDPRLSPAANAAFLAANARKPGVAVRPSGLQYRILHNGFGKRPIASDYVTVYYTGSLINGEVFDGTEPGMPARFKVNALIPGWAEALTLMRVGDHWHIVVPANMGYGERGAGETIPPNQVLQFDVELLKVVPAKRRPVGPDDDPNKVNDNEDLGPDDTPQ
jgi:FKBP-type peptidyl-prolyl cis-trans isomerase